MVQLLNVAKPVIGPRPSDLLLELIAASGEVEI